MRTCCAGGCSVERSTFTLKIAEGKKPTVALRKKFLNYAERDCLTWLTDHLSGADEIIVEMMLAFTDKWEPIPLNNYGQPVFGCGFKWDDIWCRIKSDVIVRREKECHIIDHKTGKVNEDQHEKQLDLYALGCFAYYPEVDTVNATMLYFDHGVTLDRVYTRGKDFTRLKKLWEKKVRKLLSDTRFLPTPNRLCRWCHYSGDNDGPCKAG